MANRYMPKQLCRRCQKQRANSQLDGLCLICVCKGYTNTSEVDDSVKDIRELRIPYYAGRAALGVPLFDPPLLV